MNASDMNTLLMNASKMNTSLANETDINTSLANATDMNTSIMNATDMNTQLMNAKDMNTSWMDATDMNTSWMNTTDMNTSLVNATDMIFSINSSFSNETSQAIVDSIVEKITYSIIIATLLIVTITANTLLIRVLNNFDFCQRANKIIRVAIAVLDLCIGAFTSIGFLSVFFPEYLANGNTMCTIVGAPIEGFVYTNMLFISIFSVERFIYMAYPLKYIQWMKPKSVVMAMVLVSSLVFVYCVLTSIFYVRERRAASLSCPLQNTGAIGPVIPILSPVVISSFVSFFLIKLRYDLLNNDPNQSTTQNGKKKALSNIGMSKVTFLKMLKTVVLLSGSVWLSFVPAIITRVIITRLFTFEEIENRDNVYAYTAMRFSTILITLGTSALNPIIQFWLEEDFRVGAFRLHGFRRDFSWQKRYKETFLVGKNTNTAIIA